MPSYVMLTRLSEENAATPGPDQLLERVLIEEVSKELPQVRCSAPERLRHREHLHRFEAPDHQQAVQVSIITRVRARARTELWTATEWEQFQRLG